MIPESSYGHDFYNAFLAPDWLGGEHSVDVCRKCNAIRDSQYDDEEETGNNPKSHWRYKCGERLMR